MKPSLFFRVSVAICGLGGVATAHQIAESTGRTMGTTYNALCRLEREGKIIRTGAVIWPTTNKERTLWGLK